MTKPVFVTGATGYVGGRLVPILLGRGYTVRAVGRSLDKLRCRPWGGHEKVQLAQADLFDKQSLTEAARGCGAGFYLVHSMVPGVKDFAAADRQAAYNMVRAARDAGLERLIYLSGLNPPDPFLSKHLRSRAEVAEILSLGRVPVTILKAAIIIGSGSASFELLRYLVDRLPVMITPRWVRTESQPISIRNVLDYLVGCLEHEETIGRAFDIGGNCIETYENLFRMYAEEAGLKKRVIIPVPVLSPHLSGLWVTLVTPIPSTLSRPLISGLRNRAVCLEHSIREIIPTDLMDCRQAIRTAVDKVRQHTVDTCWTDAGELSPPEWVTCGDAEYAGGTVLKDAYRIRMSHPPEHVWNVVSSVGGDTGWYFADALWNMRGLMDRLLGGVGLRRGRRNPYEIYVGDALDFWRVLAVEPNRRLLLLAEMKLPGQALLEFRLAPVGQRGTELVCIARFLPKGIAGLIYWYSVFPLHRYVFQGMLANMAKVAGCEITLPPERFKPAGGTACRL